MDNPKALAQRSVAGRNLICTKAFPAIFGKLACLFTLLMAHTAAVAKDGIWEQANQQVVARILKEETDCGPSFNECNKRALHTPAVAKLISTLRLPSKIAKRIVLVNRGESSAVGKSIFININALARPFEEQLFVLAHEAGHTQGVTAWKRVVLAYCPHKIPHLKFDDSISEMSDICVEDFSGKLQQASFDSEFDADSYAARLLKKRGIKIDYLAVFERMKVAGESDDHPAPEVRLKRLLAIQKAGLGYRP